MNQMLIVRTLYCHDRSKLYTKRFYVVLNLSIGLELEFLRCAKPLYWARVCYAHAWNKKHKSGDLECMTTLAARMGIIEGITQTAGITKAHKK